MHVVAKMAVAMEEGALKYGRFNFRSTDVMASDYCDALFRHFSAFIEGEDIDQKSGMHHLTKIMATCAVMLDAMEHDTFVDDRPESGLAHDWQDALNNITKELREKLTTQKK